MSDSDKSDLSTDNVVPKITGINTNNISILSGIEKYVGTKDAELVYKVNKDVDIYSFQRILCDEFLLSQFDVDIGFLTKFPLMNLFIPFTDLHGMKINDNKKIQLKFNELTGKLLEIKKIDKYIVDINADRYYPSKQVIGKDPYGTAFNISRLSKSDMVINIPLPSEIKDKIDHWVKLDATNGFGQQNSSYPMFFPQDAAGNTLQGKLLEKRIYIYDYNDKSDISSITLKNLKGDYLGNISYYYSNDKIIEIKTNDWTTNKFEYHNNNNIYTYRRRAHIINSSEQKLFPDFSEYKMSYDKNNRLVSIQGENFKKKLLRTVKESDFMVEIQYS